MNHENRVLPISCVISEKFKIFMKLYILQSLLIFDTCDRRKNRPVQSENAYICKTFNKRNFNFIL